MRDKLVLGHALRQHLRAEQLDLGNQFTALVASRGQILLDDERRDLVFLMRSTSLSVCGARVCFHPPMVSPGATTSHAVATAWAGS